MKNNLAGFLVLGAVLLILGGDLLIVQFWGYDYSVSNFMDWVSHTFPITMVLLGIFLGHAVWSRSKDKSNKGDQ